MAEWDFLAGGNSRRSRKRVGTPGTETSYYREEKKAIAMPEVTASETGTGQTEPGDESHWGCGVVDFLQSLAHEAEAAGKLRLRG